MSVNTNKIEVKSLVSPKPTGGSIVKMILGGMSLVTGILLMISIIGFLPGIGAFLAGFLLMYFGLPTVDVECYSCGSSVKARSGVNKAKCDSCEAVNPIKWIKAK